MIVLVSEINDFEEAEDVRSIDVSAALGGSAVIPCELPPSSPPAVAHWQIGEDSWTQKSTGLSQCHTRSHNNC